MRNLWLALCLIPALGLAVVSSAPPSAPLSTSTSTAPATTQSARDPSWAQPLTLEGVPNLHRVSPVLYRSAQPTAEGMAHLKDLGIKTVINLREFHSDEDKLAGTGLKGFSVTMNAWHIDKDDAIRVLKIINDPVNQPVLIHCQQGSDRTGTMCAVYRMAVEGWTKEQAVRELTDGGYGFHEIWLNIKPWLESMDVPQIRHAAGLDMPATAPTTGP